jgi:hypothetical protein
MSVLQPQRQRAAQHNAGQARGTRAGTVSEYVPPIPVCCYIYTHLREPVDVPAIWLA